MIVSTNIIQNAAKVYGDQGKLSQTVKNDKTKTVATQSPDEVILSTNAQEFGGMISKLQSLPDVRADKVNALSDQVAQGSYHVDAYEIASSMLSRS